MDLHVPHATVLHLQWYALCVYPPLLNNVNNLKSKCYKYFRALLLPYILLVSIVYAVDWMIGEDTSLGALLRAFSGTPGGHANAMWFVSAMFWVKILDSVAACYSKRWLLLTISIVFMVVFQLNDEAFLPRVFTYPFVAYPFFCFGLWMMQKLKVVEGKRLYWTLVPCIIIPFVAAWLLSDFDMYLLKFGGNVVVYYAVSIIGSMMIIMACKRWLNRSNELVLTLSKGSILVLAFHRLVLFAIPYGDNIYLAHIVAIATLLLFYFPIRYVQRYIPILVGGRR